MVSFCWLAFAFPSYWSGWKMRLYMLTSDFTFLALFQISYWPQVRKNWHRFFWHHDILRSVGCKTLKELVRVSQRRSSYFLMVWKPTGSPGCRRKLHSLLLLLLLFFFQPLVSNTKNLHGTTYIESEKWYTINSLLKRARTQTSLRKILPVPAIVWFTKTTTSRKRPLNLRIIIWKSFK